MCACQWELPQELAEAICLRIGGTTLTIDPKNVQRKSSKVVAGENADGDCNMATINYLILETVQDESCQMKNKQNGDGLYTWPELPPSTSGSGRLLDSIATVLSLHSHCTPTVLPLYSHCTPTVPPLYSHCTPRCTPHCARSCKTFALSRCQ